MTPHNKNKVFLNGRYITRAHKFFLDTLLIIGLTLGLGILLLLIDGGLQVRAQENLVSASPSVVSYYQVELPREYQDEKHEILDYIVHKFGRDAADAITIVRKCENSKFDQKATNHNRNGSIDYGIFQINDIHEPRFGDEFKTSWKANVDVAYEIFEERGWEAWACSEVVGVTPFWKK